MIVCNNCGTKIEMGSKFCSECGVTVNTDTQKCLHCGHELQSGDKFCISCGMEVEAVAETGQEKNQSSTHQIMAVCKNCEHFRQFKPISSLLHTKYSGSPQAQVLQKIQEDEDKLRASEAKDKVTKMGNNIQEWGRRPLMSDYCAAKMVEDKYDICEMKNRSGDCLDYKPRSGTTTRARCLTCVYKQSRGDPYATIPPGPPGHPEITSKMYEAVDARIANEILEVYHKKGEISRLPRFHDYCSFKSMALPYPNVQDDCLDYEAKFQSVLSDLEE